MTREPWCPFAIQTEYPAFPTGLFRDAYHRKGVWHTTEGGGTLEWYAVSGGIPHFTILISGIIHQHYSCNRWSRALRNLRGGVETNTDGAIQIEIQGFAGTDHTEEQLVSITRLATWLTREQHVEPAFPMGRLSEPYLRATDSEWDNGKGHFAHGHIPEQDHLDPNMTNATWQALVAGVQGGRWVEPPLTPIEVRQRMLWDAGFVGAPYTQKTYATVELWADGDDGPETKRAQAAYDRAMIPSPPPTVEIRMVPRSVLEEIQRLAAEALR